MSAVAAEDRGNYLGPSVECPEASLLNSVRFPICTRNREYHGQEQSHQRQLRSKNGTHTSVCQNPDPLDFPGADVAVTPVVKASRLHIRKVARHSFSLPSFSWCSKPPALFLRRVIIRGERDDDPDTGEGVCHHADDGAVEQTNDGGNVQSSSGCYGTICSKLAIQAAHSISRPYAT